MGDRLIDIPIDDLPLLRDLYKIDWPKFSIGYGTVDTYVRWLNQDPKIPHLRILSLNGDWSDGTFVIIDWNMLYFNTLNANFDRLERALSLVDFSKQYKMGSIGSRLLDMVHKFIKDHKLDVKIIPGTKWLRMPQAEASKIVVNCPEGITLKPLSEKDAVKANELWPFKCPGSATYLKRLAKYNISVGAFTSKGELIAWCFRIPAGSLGTLQVVDSQKRKGYGSLMVRAMAKTISDTGYDVFAPVVIDNKPSLNMFEKLGFKMCDTMHWIHPSYFENWSDDDKV